MFTEYNLFPIIHLECMVVCMCLQKDFSVLISVLYGWNVCMGALVIPFISMKKVVIL